MDGSIDGWMDCFRGPSHFMRRDALVMSPLAQLGQGNRMNIGDDVGDMASLVSLVLLCYFLCFLVFLASFVFFAFLLSMFFSSVTWNERGASTNSGRATVLLFIGAFLNALGQSYVPKLLKTQLARNEESIASPAVN